MMISNTLLSALLCALCATLSQADTYSVALEFTLATEDTKCDEHVNHKLQQLSQWALTESGLSLPPIGQGQWRQILMNGKTENGENLSDGEEDDYRHLKEVVGIVDDLNEMTEGNEITQRFLADMEGQEGQMEVYKADDQEEERALQNGCGPYACHYFCVTQGTYCYCCYCCGGRRRLQASSNAFQAQAQAERARDIAKAVLDGWAHNIECLTKDKSGYKVHAVIHNEDTGDAGDALPEDATVAEVNVSLDEFN